MLIYSPKKISYESLYKKVHKSQNRIESYHQLRAAIAKVGGKKQLYGKTDIDVEISNQCNRLVTHVIIYYNSILLSKLLEKYENYKDKEKFLSIIRRISPIAWHYHIHFLGQYVFQKKNNPIDLKELLKTLDLIL